MPLTLRQLQGRRDACIEKIQELKVLADGIGGAELGSLTFNSSGFFTGLVGMSKEEIDAFLSLFPQLPRVLEYARQAANEETKRRKFEVQIEKAIKEKAIKNKQFQVVQRKKARKKSKRLQRLAAPPASEDDSSQEMEQKKLTLELFVVLYLASEYSIFTINNRIVFDF